MKQFNKPADNMGGLIKIWAIPADQVSVSGKTVTIASADNVYVVYCSPGTMRHSEPKEETRAGIHYNTAVKGFSPGITEDMEAALKYMDPRSWVVLFMDGNGDYRLAGTKANPLQLVTDLDTGQNTADRAGCEFLFSGKQILRARFVNNPF